MSEEKKCCDGSQESCSDQTKDCPTETQTIVESASNQATEECTNDASTCKKEPCCQKSENVVDNG